MNYWYFTYTWRCGSSRIASDGLFEGEFYELILYMKKQPEEWNLTFAKAITYSEWLKLNGLVG